MLGIILGSILEYLRVWLKLIHPCFQGSDRCSFVRGVPRCDAIAAMDCLPKRPPGPVTKQIPRLDEAIASLQELQEEGEVEAAT
jgi:hypothetical protein